METLGHAQIRRHAAQADNPTPAVLDHVRGGRTRAEKGAVQCHSNGTVPFLDGNFLKVFLCPERCVTNQNVNRTESLYRGLHHLVDRIFIGNVGNVGQSLATRFEYIMGDGIRGLTVLDSVDHHGHTVAGETLCRGTTNVAGRARDHRNLAVQRGFRVVHGWFLLLVIYP